MHLMAGRARGNGDFGAATKKVLYQKPNRLPKNIPTRDVQSSLRVLVSY